MKNIAVFASGSGTNADNIIRYFKDSDLAQVKLLLSDNPQAGALAKAEKLDVNTVVIPRGEFKSTSKALEVLRDNNIDYIVLAGFLSLVPSELVRKYKGRIVNIHPALLPAYGGKGMYGERVHCAVIENGEKESGITIHAVNEHYDEGDIIAQYKVGIVHGDTPESLAQKIHALEYKYFPQVIEQQIAKL